MTCIEAPHEDRAERLYEAHRARAGSVANSTRLFETRPRAHEAWHPLNGAIEGELESRRHTLAAADIAREGGE